jgi:hypothetical protein
MRSFLTLALLFIPAIAPAQPPAAGDPLRTSVTLTDGKFGKALDARVSPVLVEGSPKFREPPLTVECWAKLASKKQFNILVASDSKSSSLHWEIYSYKDTGHFSAYLPGTTPGEVKSPVDICDDRWHHLAMQYDGKTVRLFVDAKPVAEQKVTPKPGLGPQPGPLCIGLVLFGDNRLGCDGLIDDVRISNTLRDMKSVPAAALLLDPDTVGLWAFDSPAGIAADPAWTPRPALGNVPAWEKETDKDWVDHRLREMDTGNFFNATFSYPSWQGKMMAYRGTAIPLGDTGGVLFDRNQLRMAAWWTGDFLNHSDRRFGLLNTPTPAGKIQFTANDGVELNIKKERAGNSDAAKEPLPSSVGKYHGLYRFGFATFLSYSLGKTKILDHASASKIENIPFFYRVLELNDITKSLRLDVCDFAVVPKKADVQISADNHQIFVNQDNEMMGVSVAYAGKLKVNLILEGSSLDLLIDGDAAYGKLVISMCRAKNDESQKVDVYFRAFQNIYEVDKSEFQDPNNSSLRSVKPKSQWTAPITTQGIRAKDTAPYVIDTLTVPYDNPYKALMFLSGLDFMPNGDIAVSTVHGDVWLVKGVDDKLEKLTWKRFATGLYQPMGLKVVDGKIHVLERGQLTRLHDLNDDGEADFYENVADQWHISGGEHAFDTCLETDPAGNFYFFNTGDTDTPTGGCLLQASKDGKKVDIFATGFRHPIGLGVSPTGVVTGADQEGNWMPATRLDIYKQVGFYGDMRAHHQKTPPKIYDGPLCWLPRQLDNSAGGQVWITSDKFGPLSHQMLHLSYGRCRMMLVMPQDVGGVMQAGTVDLGLQFLSGVMRARLNPKDGHLYLCGMDGWQTAAIRDGCLQRVRYTGKPAALPVSLAVHKNGIRLGFSQPVPKKLAEDVSRYRIEQWNYRWSGDYGSKRWSVKEPEKEGQDRVEIQSATLLDDGKSVFLRVADLRPVMQMQINYDLMTAEGQTLQGAIYNTIHQLGEPLHTTKK